MIEQNITSLKRDLHRNMMALMEELDVLDKRLTRSEYSIERDMADLKSHLSHTLRGMEVEIERLQANVNQLNSGFFTYVDNKLREVKEYFLSYIPGLLR